jgi:Tfp pilus assembly protein PilN
MRQLDIDFGTAKHGLRPVSRTLLIVGILLLILASWELRLTENDLIPLREELLRIKQRPSERLEKLNTARLSPKEIEAINRAIRQLNLPWENLLAVFEGEKYQVAALLALTPSIHASNPGQQPLRIQAEAKSADSMSEFVKALQEEKIFSDVAITHHEINDQDPNRPIRFTVDANWNLP